MYLQLLVLKNTPILLKKLSTGQTIALSHGGVQRLEANNLGNVNAIGCSPNRAELSFNTYGQKRIDFKHVPGLQCR